MEPIIIAAIVISGTIGMISSAIYHRRFAKIRRKLRKADFKRIQHVQDGQIVTIAGNVVFHKRFVKAPLSERQCVYYHTTVERKKNSGKKSQWVKEIDEASAVDFILDDGEDLALIEANAIEGYLEKDSKYKSQTFVDATPIMEAFLDKYNLTSTGPMGLNKTMKYREGALEKHEYVVVCGQCFWEKAVDHDIKDREMVLVIRATNKTPLYLSDVKDVLVK